MSKPTISETERAVRRLAAEHPDWLTVLDAAVAVAESAESHGGEFAGAWVVDELSRRRERRWVSNLRIFVSYGLLEKSGESTRGGRRAYYRMPERARVAEALATVRGSLGPRPTAPRFVASGESTDPPTDVGRRAGDLVFEPRSWR